MQTPCLSLLSCPPATTNQHVSCSTLYRFHTGTGGAKCEETRSVSVCMPRKTVAGQTASMFAQGEKGQEGQH